MFDDQITQIKDFLNQNFVPGTLEDFEFHYTNQQLLASVQDMFPENSIDDFDLTEQLTKLGFKRAVVTTENVAILKFLEKLKKEIPEDYLENCDLLEDLTNLELANHLPTNTFCWLFKNRK